MIDTYHVDMEHKATLREQEVQEEKNRLMEVVEENMSENTVMMEGNNNVRFSVNYSVAIRKTVNTNEMARQIGVTYNLRQGTRNFKDSYKIVLVSFSIEANVSSRSKSCV